MRRLLVPVALTGLFAAAAIAFALQALASLDPLPQARAAVAPSAGASGPTPPSVPSLAPTRFERFAEALDRPLFVEGRRPPATPKARAPRAAVRALPLAGTALLGVVESGAARIALLSPPGEGATERVREGALFRGWRLARADERSVVLTRDGVEHRLAISFKSSAASAPAASARDAPARGRAPARALAHSDGFSPY
ncbi:MAG: hypothetical protein ACFBWO_02045 [Paracoccaceae bacterium]